MFQRTCDVLEPNINALNRVQRGSSDPDSVCFRSEEQRNQNDEILLDDESKRPNERQMETPAAPPSPLTSEVHMENHRGPGSSPSYVTSLYGDP